MSAFTPKNYQQKALDAVRDFFRHCGAGQPGAKAFAKVTEDLYEQPLAYTPLKGYDREMPYFCLRVPTGGGKTWLAAKAVKLVNQDLLRTENSVILWLTPSSAICAQTIAGLKNPAHPLHQALLEAGAVTVLSLDEAKSLSRASLDTSTVIIVATRQAFQVENEGLRKVYENSGTLQHHFANLPPEAEKYLLHELDQAGNDTVPCSLVNVLRLRRPFIIVDEAHNNRTELAFDTLGKFLPSGIMELTATPDTRKNPSNVLYSVSAVELKNEEMIKLPIILETVSDWQQCLAEAIDCRNRLEACLDADYTPGQSRQKPLMLIQAEPKSAGRDSLHWEVIKKELIENQAIPEAQICVATGEETGLEALDKKYAGGINDPACPVRYVITQKALAEDWDCPWAYVLVSVANAHSATAVEQLLGRVLRQPDARRQASDALNNSYAFVVSNNFTATANSLRDQLVSVAGFEQKMASQFVVPQTASQFPLFRNKIEIAIPEDAPIRTVPHAIQHKVHWNELTRTLTIKEKLETKEILALQNLVDDTAIKAQIAQSAREIPALPQREITPSEMGEKVIVPQLSLISLIDGQELREPFIDAAGQLQPQLKIAPCDVIPSSEDLSLLFAEKSAAHKIDVNESGRIVSDFMGEVQLSLSMAYPPQNWTAISLAAWLCRQIASPWLAHPAKLAFVQTWLDNLFKNNLPLSQAIRKKAIIRSLIEARLESLRQKAVNEAGQLALFSEQGKRQLRVDDFCPFEFSKDNYFPASLYDPESSPFGAHRFKRHYYPLIGNFDSQEEFECAIFLDEQAIKGRIKFWIRNLVKSPNSFSLIRLDGRFYPDFVCVLPDERIVVVEYKGADRWTTEKAEADRKIGQLWAELSNGKCQFIMVKTRDWNSIDALLK